MVDVADPSFYAALPPESSSLSPLPPAVRSGLTAVTVLASISLVSTTALFVHLTYKLVLWHLQRPKKQPAQDDSMPMSPGMDLTLGLAERHFGFGRPASSPRVVVAPRPKREPNQFVVLIYNLLLADMHQSIAFFLNAVWVGKDAIHVRSRTCWMQGYFVSTGDLSASLFIGAIAVHTYGTIVRGYKPPQWVIVSTCVGIWLFNYLMVAIGVLGTNNGQATGGFYVRAAAWVSNLLTNSSYYEQLSSIRRAPWVACRYRQGANQGDRCKYSVGSTRATRISGCSLTTSSSSSLWASPRSSTSSSFSPSAAATGPHHRHPRRRTRRAPRGRARASRPSISAPRSTPRRPRSPAKAVTTRLSSSTPSSTSSARCRSPPAASPLWPAPRSR